MEQNQKLYEFITNHAEEITDEWLRKVKVGRETKYSRETREHGEQEALDQYKDITYSIANIFISKKVNPTDEIQDWAQNISEKRVAEQTPIHETLQNFKTYRVVLWNRMKDFFQDAPVDLEHILRWTELLQEAYDYMVLQFTEHYYKTNIKQLHAQEQLINELSSPVIPITNEEAILPLIGDLDRKRISNIQSTTLERCSQHSYERIYLDMSGVESIDTIVAHHLFQLIQSLELLGVTSVICGMNPKVAQVAIQLGIDFTQIPIKSTLSHALDELGSKQVQN
ncbi:STAS domain-containing protein [Pontibacillus marinus]|uniref:STAS domain-containing protein n=1 Tax=Pontibacillus marinus BH030004 = DSM 16465 TaxID=1385511 RepID=A0A0A5I368_9BACI|nr:STAS domain-containing protein [Pontibacillus marinus]KGX90282.1 hypothetical protein N783_21060 [Pontibacillus marinus BH030004 = DSM 16465]